MKTVTRSKLVTFAALLSALVVASVVSLDIGREEVRSSRIIQGASLEEVRHAVEGAGGEITHELRIINAVAAELTSGQVEALRRADGIRRIYGNDTIKTAGKPSKDGGSSGGDTSPTPSATDTYYATLVNADPVHQMGIDGSGIGIAVLDTGLWKHNGVKYDNSGNVRIDAVYNAMTNTLASSPMSGDDPAGTVRMSRALPNRA